MSVLLLPLVVLLSSAPEPAIAAARIGPVPVSVMATLVDGLGLKGHFDHAPRPFFLSDTPIRPLRQPASLECKWTGDEVSPRYVDPRTKAGITGGLADVGDWESPRNVFEVGTDLSVRRWKGKRIDSWSDPRNYRVTFLCAHERDAAFTVEFEDGPLDGRGWLVVLQGAGSDWHVLSQERIWAS